MGAESAATLFFYGPFMRGGKHTAPSNAPFDADLRRRDPRWGVRDVDDLVSQTATHGLDLRDVVEMPANNLSLVFVNASPAAADFAIHVTTDAMG